MSKQKLKVCWISAGVSSFIAGYLAKDVDRFIYIDIENQHPDSIRFIEDCEKALGRKIERLQSQYKNIQNVISAFRFINGPYGAKCTDILKKRVRKEWEWDHREYEITYVWGFDCTEKHRADRLEETMIEFNHEFPLLDRNLTKEDAHGMLASLGIKRPLMYDLGYKNNNCIGCVNGGMGYWNKIRVDFPEAFQRMAALEREIGHSCLKGIYLDELEPDRGRIEDEIMQDCGIMCYLAMTEQSK
jgi:3'-phosphoadenosine 5'-phosphosulfate sulfotransferase (PAPS reductase)/FAD synthetase